MKKYLCLMLVLLLLTGCAGQGSQEPTEETQPRQEGLYAPEHTLEQQTDSAVRVYPLGTDCYTNLYMMGSKVLLISGEGDGTVLHGDNGIVTAEHKLEGFLPGTSVFDVDVKGAAYYVPESREVVLLNPQLQETNRIQLPEDVQGKPAISLASNEIFFCRPNEIRALNISSGIARLIKSHIVTEQTITGCYFNGKVIGCLSTDSNNIQRQLYLDASNGTTLEEDSWVYELKTCEDRLFVRRIDNRIDQIIIGTLEGERKLLSLQEGEIAAEALALNGAVSYRQAETGTILSFHDFSLGQTTAQITLHQVGAPMAIGSDQHFIWALVQDPADTGTLLLLRWDVSKSQLAQPAAATATLFTADAPDTEGLKLCEDKADDLNDAYGVRVSVWEDAVKKTGGYQVTAEHQPAILDEMMTRLEPALQLYPDGFLRKTVKSGWIRIGLVRSIESGEPWVQYWENGDCYLLLTSQADFSEAFLETLGYAVDSRVLGNSRDYDTWNQLNPERFVYTAEAEGQTQDVAAYMDGETRAFVNMQAITSATEDRRQLFIAAMGDGNESVFQSAAMQAKLRRMCEGIREAYGLEKKKELFRWEQYLTEPMVQIDG